MTEEQNKYALQFTRKALFVWGGLIFFVMAWMFVLGILVGRGTVPIPIQTHVLEKELQDKKTAMLQKQKDEIQAQAKQGREQGDELKFFEELKKPVAQTPYKINAPPPVEKRPALSPTPVPTLEKSAAPAAASAGDKPQPAPTAAPAEDKPKPMPVPEAHATSTPVPAAKPKPVAPSVKAEAAPAAKQGRFTIQAGSFKDVESAEQVAKTLRTKGYSAYQLRMEVPGKGAWFRVRVGAFEERAAAEAVLKKLAADKVAGMVVEAGK